MLEGPKWSTLTNFNPAFASFRKSRLELTTQFGSPHKAFRQSVEYRRMSLSVTPAKRSSTGSKDEDVELLVGPIEGLLEGR